MHSKISVLLNMDDMNMNMLYADWLESGPEQKREQQIIIIWLLLFQQGIWWLADTHSADSSALALISAGVWWLQLSSSWLLFIFGIPRYLEGRRQLSSMSAMLLFYRAIPSVLGVQAYAEQQWGESFSLVNPALEDDVSNWLDVGL